MEHMFTILVFLQQKPLDNQIHCQNNILPWIINRKLEHLINQMGSKHY